MLVTDMVVVWQSCCRNSTYTNYTKRSFATVGPCLGSYWIDGEVLDCYVYIANFVGGWRRVKSSGVARDERLATRSVKVTHCTRLYLYFSTYHTKPTNMLRATWTTTQ